MGTVFCPLWRGISGCSLVAGRFTPPLKAYSPFSDTRLSTFSCIPRFHQVSELITKLESERNQLQEQLERAAQKEAEVVLQVRSTTGQG